MGVVPSMVEKVSTQNDLGHSIIVLTALLCKPTQDCAVNISDDQYLSRNGWCSKYVRWFVRIWKLLNITKVS